MHSIISTQSVCMLIVSMRNHEAIASRMLLYKGTHSDSQGF